MSVRMDMISPRSSQVGYCGTMRQPLTRRYESKTTHLATWDGPSVCVARLRVENPSRGRLAIGRKFATCPTPSKTGHKNRWPVPLRSLETQPESKLHDARIGRQRRDHARSASADVRVRQAEGDGVGEVKRLGAELQLYPLREREVARNRNVQVVQAGATQRIAPGVSENSRSRQAEGVR